MRPVWQHSKLILGLVIGVGYIYNVIVDGLPDSAASAPEKWGFYVGTTLGLLAAALLVYSGLRGRKKGK